MIKHVSYKIQNAIQIELFSAKESIKIAVAWFTNELLLHPLVLKLQTGVSVEIILNDDNINKGGESSLDFTSFLEAGGVLRWNTSKQLLHEKFCIIDDRIVISGSYNWTNKAEYNDEVETFYFDEQETCGFFNSQFLKLQRKYEATKRIRPTQAAEIEEIEEKEYYENGNLKYEGLTRLGLRVKEWKFYYENGKLQFIGDYKYGEQNGLWKIYYENGNIKNIANYDYGKLVGLVRNYEEDGKFSSTTYYEEGSNLTKWQFFYKDGKSIKKEGMAYDMGEEAKKRWIATGEWKYYSKAGKLQKIETYENGEIIKVEKFK